MSRSMASSVLPEPSDSVIGVQCECTIQHCGTALSVTDNIRERITSSGRRYGIVSTHFLDLPNQPSGLGEVPLVIGPAKRFSYRIAACGHSVCGREARVQSECSTKKAQRFFA